MGFGKEALAADYHALEKDPPSVLANAHLAWTFVGLGEYAKAIEQAQKALQFLGKSFEEHDFWLPWLHLDAALHPLQKDKRFQELLGRISRTMVDSSGRLKTLGAETAELSSRPAAALVGRAVVTG